MHCGSSMPMAFALSDRLLQATFRMAKLWNSVCFAKGLLPEITSDAVCPARVSVSTQRLPCMCCGHASSADSGQCSVSQQMVHKLIIRMWRAACLCAAAGRMPSTALHLPAQHRPASHLRLKGHLLCRPQCAQCPFPLLFLNKRCKPFMKRVARQRSDLLTHLLVLTSKCQEATCLGRPLRRM